MRALLVCVLLTLCMMPVSSRVDASANAPPARATTEIGMLKKAAYRVDIPANWNRALVVYFHGYEIEPIRFGKGEPIPPMFAPLLEDGYAVIQSAYSQAGWAVEQGGADSERLRAYFIAKYGQPKQTFAIGLSMGGTLTVMALESAPRAAAYLSRWYTPTGKLLKPLLALHNTGDPLVVASTAFEYALLAQRAGHAGNFVQQYVNAEGHCNFTPVQIGRAFNELVDWSHAGKRPVSGALPKG